jgi:squalene-hopene/tetraprenyl-beta-curcumene cyclase
MLRRLAIILVLMAAPAFGQDWNPQLAAQYLDSRQAEWFTWPEASTPEGPCISCHTSMTYLLARPALRRALGEVEPTRYERGLVDGLRARVGKKSPEKLASDPSAPLAAEAVFSALFLAMEPNDESILTAETKQAFDQLWSLQILDGKAKGAWPWFSFDLDPWETPDSTFYGATLAALAVGFTPSEYRDRTDVRDHLHPLTEYMQREQQAQPLHNRLTWLWASSKFPSATAESARQSIIRQILQKQQADGGWTIDSLGPWRPHAQAPPSAGSNSYATGFVAFVLQQSGVGRSHPALSRALEWLRSHQDQQFGYWPADSMNKRYPTGSMPARFMQDAATAFAALALLADSQPSRK